MEFGKRAQYGRSNRIVALARYAGRAFPAELHQPRCLVERAGTVGHEVVERLEPIEIDETLRVFHESRERGCGVGLFECSELRTARSAAASRGRRERIDDEPAAQRSARRLVPQYETIAAQRAYWLVQYELHDFAGARGECGAAPYRKPCGHVARRKMEVHRRPVLHRLRFGRQNGDARVDAASRSMQRSAKHPVAA